MNWIINFFNKFFGFEYFYDSGVVRMRTFADGLGKGFLDVRHIIWIEAAIFLAVFLYQVSRDHKKFGRIFSFVLAFVMLAVRFLYTLSEMLIGAKMPTLSAMPFQICDLMILLLPVVLLFDIKSLKTPVYIISIITGMAALVFGGCPGGAMFFDDKFMTFSMLESLCAHTLLLVLPFLDMGAGRFRIDYKKSWTVAAAVLLLIVWGTVANRFIFEGLDTNYMYLNENILPGNFGGDYFVFVYLAIVAVVSVVIFTVPEIYRGARRRSGKKRLRAAAR